MSTIRLAQLLPSNPLVIKLLDVNKSTAARAIGFLRDAGIVCETTGKRRGRVYAYRHYLQALTPDTE